MIEDGDEPPCVPGHLLGLVLFLQGVGRRKVVEEEREEEVIPGNKKMIVLS